MIVRPTVNDLLQYADNRYALVIAVSRRARQLAKGSEKLIEEQDRSTVTTAAKEMVEGKIEIV